METSIKQWFTAPVFEGDEMKTRRASFLNATLLMTLLYLGITIPVYFLDGITRTGVGVLLSILFFAILLLRHLMWRGKVTLAGSGMALLAFLTVLMINVTNGTAHAPVTLGYLFVIIMAGVLFEWRGVLVSVSACSLAVLGLILAENAGVLPQPIHTVTLTNWITYTGVFGLIGGVSLWGQQTMQQVLARAENEITERKQAEEALRQSRERYRFLVDNSSDFITRVNLDSQLIFVTEVSRSFIGYEPDEMIATSAFEYIHPDDHDFIRQKFKLLFEIGDVIAEFRARRKDGSYFWAESTARRRLNEAGEPEAIIVHRNITARKQTENALRTSEARYRSLFNDAPVMIWEEDFSAAKARLEEIRKNAATDLLTYLEQRPEIVTECLSRMKILNVNRAVLQLYGARNLNHLLENLPQTFTAESFQAFKEALVSLADNRPHFECETTQRAFDGTCRRVFMRSFLQHSEDDNSARVIVTMLDITAQKQAEDENIKLRNAVENAADVIFITDKNGIIEYVNPAFEAVTGYSRAKALGKTPRILKSGLMDKSYYDKMWATILSGDTFRAEVIEREKNGEIFYYDQTISSIVNSRGIVTHFVSTGKDVTERRKVEDDLKQSREMYRLLAENISDVIWILDLNENKFSYVSPSVERLRGYTAEEVLAQDMNAAMTAESLRLIGEKLPPRVAAYQQGMDVFGVDEIEQPCKDGSTVWTETTTNFHLNETNGHLEVYGVSRNITERKHIEALLNLRLKLLEASAPLSLDEFMQKALDEVGEFVNSPVGFYHFVEADQKTLSLQAWSTRTLNEFCKMEGRGLHYPIDQAGVWADCVAQRKPVIHNDYAALPASRRKGLPEGHAPVIRELVVPVLREGCVVSIFGVGNKSTEYNERDLQTVAYMADVIWEIVRQKQSEAEVQRLYAQAQEDARIKADLLNEVNHRVKNNLTRIQSIFKLKNLEVGLNDREQDLLTDMQIRIGGMLAVHNMLSDSLWSPLELGELCWQIVRGALESSPIKSNLALDISFQPEACSRQMIIPGQATTLALILNELAMNSVKYAFANCQSGRIQIALTLEAKNENNLLYLMFRDDGPGWAEEVLSGQREGLGLRLIRGSLQSLPQSGIQLRNEGGAVTLIQFKLAQP